VKAAPGVSGAYTGGFANSGTRLQWKSTEQNIDVYAFFSLLGRVSGLAAWAARASTARRFIVSMWNPAAGRFSLGTMTDGVTTNDNPQTEDVNSWSCLALASRDRLTDCEGDFVYASPHTGTTAWYILAARRINPLSATTPISAQ
jgi:hypothetical protein